MTLILSETLAIVKSFAHNRELLVDEQAGVGRQISRDAGGGGVGAVHGAESVGDEDLGHVGKSLGKGGVVLGLALGKTEVLQKEDLAGLQRGGLGLGVGADGVGGEDDVLTQQLAETLGNGSERQLGEGLLPLFTGDVGLVLALFHLLLHIALEGGDGLAEVGARDNGSAVVKQITDRRESRDDTLVRGDLAGLLVLGDVEVAAEKNFLALDVYVVNGLFAVVHGYPPKLKIFHLRAISPTPCSPGKPCWRSVS